MRRWSVQLIGGIIGIASFFVLPGAFKFLGFFFSILAFSISCRASGERFSIHILLISLFLFVLFGTNVFTFDASNPIDWNSLSEYVSKGLNTLIIVLCFGVPLMLIIGAIWAFIIGQIMSSIKALFYAFIMVVVILAFAYISELVGLPDFGAGDWILDFYEGLMSYIFELPIAGYEGIDQAMLNTGLGFDLPDIPENKHFRSPTAATEGGGGAFSTGNGILDGVLNGGLGYGSNLVGGATGGGGGGGGSNSGTDLVGSIVGTVTGGSTGISFSALSYKDGLYATQDALPLFAAMINLISIPFFFSKRSEEILVAFFDKLKLSTKRRTPPLRQIGERTTKIDPVMVSMLMFIMIAAWFIFLAYTNSYGENAREDWRYIIFIYYALVTLFSGVMLMFVFRNYTPVTIWSFIKGTVYGLIGLFFISRLFMSRVTFNAFSSVEMHNNYWYALNTFVFIAPAETLVFCVALPCFFLWLILRGERKALQGDSLRTKQQRLNKLELLIVAQQGRIELTQRDIEWYSFVDDRLIQVKKEKGTKTSLEKINTKKKVAKLTDQLKERNTTLTRLKTLKTKVEQEDITVSTPSLERDNILASQPVKLFVFVVGIVVAAIVFASLHWAVISAELPFNMYWMTGMAVIFAVAGLWMSIISWRYDWLSACTCHAIFNASTILLVLLSAGA